IVFQEIDEIGERLPFFPTPGCSREPVQRLRNITPEHGNTATQHTDMRGVLRLDRHEAHVRPWNQLPLTEQRGSRAIPVECHESLRGKDRGQYIDRRMIAVDDG